MYVQLMLLGDTTAPPHISLQHNPNRKAGSLTLSALSIPGFSVAHSGDLLFTVTPGYDQMWEGELPLFFLSSRHAAQHLCELALSEESMLKFKDATSAQYCWINPSEDVAISRIEQALLNQQDITIVRDEGESIGFAVALRIHANTSPTDEISPADTLIF